MGRQRLTKDARREQLLDAALRAFVRDGYHGTQVAQIIEEAGVARGTFYLHFESKHAVFAELIERMLSILLEVAPESTPADLESGRKLETFLRESYTAIFTSLHRNRRLAALLFEEAIGIDKGFAQRLERYYGQWRDRITRLMAALEARGLASPGPDPRLTADLVLGAVDRIARRHVIRAARPDIPALVEAVVTFELAAVRARRR